MQSRSSECTRAGEAPIGRFRRGPPSLPSHWPTTPAQQGREAPQPWECLHSLIGLRDAHVDQGPIGGEGCQVEKGVVGFSVDSGFASLECSLRVKNEIPLDNLPC